MSKKWFLNSALILATSLTLVACGSKQEEAAPAASSTVASSTASSEEATSGATVSELVDGTYTAEGAEFDERGWKVTHTIVVEGAKVVESNFDYINAEGQLKTEDEDYNTKMKEGSGVSVVEAAEQLNAGVVATPGLENIEVVSGATHTTEDFTKSIAELIAAAKAGNTETVILK